MSIRRKKRLFFLLLLVGLLLICNGCWDVNEIDDRAVILALGLDFTPEGKILTSAQIPIWMDIASRTLGGQAPEKPFIVKTSEAETVFGAIPGLQSKTARDLFLGQLKMVIISAPLARKGLKPLIDFLDRHPEIPPQVLMVVTEESAKEIIDSTLGSKEIPGLAVRYFLESPSKADLVYSLRVSEIMRAFLIGFEDAYMPVISYDSREKTYVINGIGVFQKDRMVGQLNPIETRMFGFLSGRARNAYPSIQVGGLATFRGVQSKVKTRAIAVGDRISFIIQVRAEGFLADLTSAKGKFSPKDIQGIETKTEKEITNGMVKTIRRLQEMNTDILGFGELLRATKPEVWQRIDWDSEYPKVGVSIDCKFKIKRSGVYR